MASVFKRKYEKRPRADGWSAARTPSNSGTRRTRPRGVGVVRQVPGFDGYEASVELGHRLETLARLRAAGEAMPDDLRRYTDKLPSKVRSKLAKWGLLSMPAEAAKRGLSEHVAAYEAALRGRNGEREAKGPAGDARTRPTKRQSRPRIDPPDRCQTIRGHYAGGGGPGTPRASNQGQADQRHRRENRGPTITGRSSRSWNGAGVRSS